MSEGSRPGGLTALAVLNFVFAGLGILGLLAVFALLSAAESVTVSLSEGQASLTDAPGAFVVVVQLLFGVAACILLIASGVGYLGQKKFSGQTLGNAYAVVSIVSAVYGMIVLSSGFGVFTLIGLIYPVLTLILLNTTFKNDFVNP
ncbi:hypothetical protein JXA47_04160 [Candidatus Sumerlaeota bacterium]|nr:hypothetical protein [Candidatus Sumerlaeota bacterium]